MTARSNKSTFKREQVFVAVASWNVVMCKWSFTEASWLKLTANVCQRGVEWDARMVINLVFYEKGSLLLFVSSEWSDQKVFSC